jgi:Fe-S-cluster containining protein
VSDVLGRTPCDICKGACCEIFSVNFNGVAEDTLRWIRFHGIDMGEVPSGMVAFNCRCSKLNNHGKCSIYDSRPEICRKFPVGSPACLKAVHERRSIHTAAKIEMAISRQVAYQITKSPDGQGVTNVG